MVFKIVILAGFVAIVNAAVLHQEEARKLEEYDSHPSYSFSYDVQDANTGDYKSQTESRDGDLVQGEYSLYEPDGYRRVVQYSSDATSGFRATVRREPLDAAGAVKQVAAQANAIEVKQLKAEPEAKTTYAQPAAAVYRAISAPTLVHHTPAHTVLHTAPAVHLAPAAHYVHAAPVTTTTLLKASPGAVIAHHGSTPIVKTSFAAPHYHYVY